MVLPWFDKNTVLRDYLTILQVIPSRSGGANVDSKRAGCWWGSRRLVVCATGPVKLREGDGSALAKPRFCAAIAAVQIQADMVRPFENDRSAIVSWISILFIRHQQAAAGPVHAGSCESRRRGQPSDTGTPGSNQGTPRDWRGGLSGRTLAIPRSGTEGPN